MGELARIASTFHDDSMEDVTTRRGAIQKTSAALDYIKNTGGVDKNVANFEVTSWLENV